MIPVRMGCARSQALHLSQFAVWSYGLESVMYQVLDYL